MIGHMFVVYEFSSDYPDFFRNYHHATILNITQPSQRVQYFTGLLMKCHYFSDT